MPDPNGQPTTQTAYSAGYAYVEQSSGYNSFGESLGTKYAIPSVPGTTGTTLAGTWAFTNTYSTTNGLLLSTAFPQEGGLPKESVGTTYNSLGMPVAIGGSLYGYQTAQDTYDAYGQMTIANIGNNTAGNTGAITDTYDLHTGSLTNQLVTRDTGTTTDVDQIGYTYDPTGLTTGESDTRLNSTSTAEQQCFTYTNQNQLSQAWTTTAANCNTVPTATSHTTVGDNLAPSSAYDESWTYNAAGDQATETQYSPLTGATQTTNDTYNGNGDSQPTTLTSTSTTTSGSSTPAPTSYSYDPDGQQISRTTSAGDQTLNWDQGQLIGVTNTTSGTNSSYIYDPSGSLLIETDGSNTTLYLPNEQVTVNGSGTIQSCERYIALPGGITVVRTGTATTAFSYEISSDQHGTNTLQLDYTAQNPSWRQDDPYGNSRGTAQTWVDNRGFLDDPDDSATALTDVGARWYDPTTGSFVSLDPKFETTDPTQLGGYDYSGNDPVSSSDPTGEMPSPGGPLCSGQQCTTDEKQLCENGGGSWVNGVCDTGGTTTTSKGTTNGGGDTTSAASKTVSALLGIANTRMPDAWGFLYGFSEAQEEALTSPFTTAWGFTDQTLICLEGKGSECEAGLKHLAVQDLEASIPGYLPAKIGLNLYQGFASGDSVTEGETTANALMLASAFIDPDAALAMCGGESFSAKTAVLLADGKSAPIASLKQGEKVKSANTATGNNETETVEAVLVNHDTDLYHLTVANGYGTTLIDTTFNHPFWDDTTHAWVDAGKLHAGDHLHTADGMVATVVGGATPGASTGWMWDLTISNDHDFYVVVGGTTVLVHNCPSGDSGPNWSPKSRPTFGHSFSEHGAGSKITQSLTDRARSTGKSQGQWLDNDAAAQFMQDNFVPGAGPRSSIIPEGLGQVIMPDGSIVPAGAATFVPSPGGLYKTSFPIIGPGSG